MAIPDAPPKVDFTEPGGLNIPCRSHQSDYAPFCRLGRFRGGGGPDSLPPPGIPGAGTEGAAPDASGLSGFRGEAELDLSGLKLDEYELVATTREARDNNTLDGPGIGKSPTYFIEITDKEGKVFVTGQGARR